MPPRIAVMLDSLKEFSNGCFFTRHYVPFTELQRRKVTAGFVSMNGYYTSEVVKDNDIVIFTRVYNSDPFRHLWKLKSKGMKIAYELDDDVWNIPKSNPAHNTFEVKKHEVADLCRESDAVIVSTETLAKLVKNLPDFNKPIFVCPNAVNRDMFKPRPKENKKLRIGWSGGANHYEDLDMVLDYLLELDKKYEFEFIIQGLTGSPLEAEMFNKKMSLKRGQIDDKATLSHINTALSVFEKLNQLKDFKHVPFYPPEMYPQVLTSLDLDIGIAFTTEARFNRSKSAIKFYEYAAVGTTTIASNLLPYKNEVKYTAWGEKEWKKKLSALIEDKQLRDKVLKEQQDYVFNNRDIQVVGRTWEDTYKKIHKL